MQGVACYNSGRLAKAYDQVSLSVTVMRGFTNRQLGVALTTTAIHITSHHTTPSISAHDPWLILIQKLPKRIVVAKVAPKLH